MLINNLTNFSSLWNSYKCDYYFVIFYEKLNTVYMIT